MKQLLKPVLAMRVTGLAEVLCRPAVFAPLLLGLAVSISSWFANRGLPTSDEGAVLTWTAKILRGGVFYRNIDAYPGPGAAYFLALWMWLLGEHLTVARVVAAGVYCLVVSSLYFASLQLLGRPRAVLFGFSLLSFKFLTERFHPWPFATLYPGDVESDRGRGPGRLLFREPPEVVVTGLLSWPGVPDLRSYAPALYFYVSVLFERDDSWLGALPDSSWQRAASVDPGAPAR